MLNSYDKVPYESYPYPQSHPRRLATIAHLLGMEVPDFRSLKILELGCSSGGNLLPLVEQLAGSPCIGIDGSERQIEQGRTLLQSAGLRNVTLLHEDIRQFDLGRGPFDFIIVHGVYSWVPDDVQRAILNICRHTLAPHGVAYISYNTYPGWRLRGMIRDLMLYRASFFERPDDQLREGMALIDFLAKSVPQKDNAYGMLLSTELESLRPKAESYLIHEHLEENNRPDYFHEFMRRAGEYQLQYLGEADYSTMAASNFPADVEKRLRELAAAGSDGQSDVIQMEQYMDFVRNRLFRQTLLCRAEVPLDRRIPPARAQQLHAASNAEAEGEGDLRAAGRTTFRRRGSTLTTSEPLIKAAMLQLREAWPRYLHFSELLAGARARLQRGARVVDARLAQEEADSLGRVLIQCYSTTHIDLCVQPLPYTLEIPPRPRCTRLARHQATLDRSVTNLMHESVRLSDIERRLLPHLDGEHERSDLLALLKQDVAAGRLVAQDNGAEVKDPAELQAVLGNVLNQALTGIAHKGLLQPAT
jgi:methyltransferase-like protein/SAM-dependent methyltransferase